MQSWPVGWRLPDSLFAFLTRDWTDAQLEQLAGLLTDIQLISEGVYQLADGEQVKLRAASGQRSTGALRQT